MDIEELANGQVLLHAGDCLDVMAKMAPDSIDAGLSDPPYHFASIIKRWSKSAATDRVSSGAMGRHSRGFMGKDWDGGDIAFRPETWAAVLRVLKPGAHLIAFGAPKNEHRLTCAIEDAGFEIRDKLMWVFGVGFPKSHDAEKAMGKATDTDLFREAAGSAADKWAGWGTALKPAYEPIILARKPLIGTVQENLREFGTGAINIDGCRIDATDATGGSYKTKRFNHGRAVDTTGEWKSDVDYEDELKPGRFPANLVHDGSPDVVDLFPAEAGAQAPVHKRGSDKFQQTYGAFKGDIDEGGSTFRGDSGSAARFFYCAKAVSGERVYRCKECGLHSVGKPPCGHKKLESHPTVKPIALMRWLCRLIVPPGGLVLDPFAGTGTTGAAALAEGARAVLIEREAAYREDIKQRLGALETETA